MMIATVKILHIGVNFKTLTIILRSQVHEKAYHAKFSIKHNENLLAVRARNSDESQGYFILHDLH